MRQYGVASDTELEGVVDEFINDTIRDYNSRTFEFNKRKETITFVANTAEYTLTAGTFLKESMCYLIQSSNSAVRSTLVYLPYVHFQATYADGNYGMITGVPEVYTIRNVNNDGIVTFAPAPSDTTYKAVIEYYRRIPILSEESPIKAIPEIEVPLMYGAMKRLAIHLYGPGHPDVAGFDSLERQALEEVAAIDKQHPDARMRFILCDKRAAWNQRRALYIKVS